MRRIRKKTNCCLCFSNIYLCIIFTVCFFSFCLDITYVIMFSFFFRNVLLFYLFLHYLNMKRWSQMLFALFINGLIELNFLFALWVHFASGLLSSSSSPSSSSTFSSTSFTHNLRNLLHNLYILFAFWMSHK